jgi:hypothetical protein
MYLPQFEVLHYKGASVGIRKETSDITTATKETKKRMRRETTKAMRLFVESHYQDKYPRWFVKFVFFGIDTLSKVRELGLFIS